MIDLIKKDIRDGYHLAEVVTDLIHETCVYKGFTVDDRGNENHHFDLVMVIDNFLKQKVNDDE